MATVTALQKQTGMGAMPHPEGVAFRVWAPHADQVCVAGDFNEWSPTASPLEKEENGYWYTDLSDVQIGHEYRYVIQNGDQTLWRVDPYAREVTNSIGNAIVHNSDFDWEGDQYQLPPVNELIIYELHIGTFGQDSGEGPASIEHIVEQFDHLRHLGVNALQLMPLAEFAGDFSWGYNPAHIFAVESSYGGPEALKRFVKQAHQEGFGVILDVVYNHFGPSDLDHSLWKFDGWSENGGGGTYFYNDWRAESPWGATRPDYGRGEVRQFIRDNAIMWLEDYHIDGLRFDMTLFMRSVRGDEQDPGDDLPDGWGLTQWINREIRERLPHCITIAEDLRNNQWLTKGVDDGGAGFTAQWDAGFVHTVRAAVTSPEDRMRSMQAIRGELYSTFNGDPFQRIVYSESHDEVANGKQRIPSEVSPTTGDNYYAQKLSTLAAGFVFTAPGIPMLFQGQEFLEGGWFRDDVPLDWSHTEDFAGIVRLYRDLIKLRLNREGMTQGLLGRGVNVFRLDDHHKVICFHRWDQHGPQDDVVVIANLSAELLEEFRIGFPTAGQWHLCFNSDARVYSESFHDHASQDVDAEQANNYDGFPAAATVSIAPYTMLIYSQQADQHP